MGCCLPKSFRGAQSNYVERINIYDCETNNFMDEEFNIEKGLVMFGQNTKSENFILTFDFYRKVFDQIKVPNGRKI